MSSRQGRYHIVLAYHLLGVGLLGGGVACTAPAASEAIAPKGDPDTVGASIPAKPNPPARAGGPTARAPFNGPVLEVHELAGGLIIEDYVIGGGEAAKLGNKLTMHYEGRSEAGERFDSSRIDQRPYVFKLAALGIPLAWALGLRGVRAGGARRVIAPAKLAGPGRHGQSAPSEGRVIYDFEVLEVAPRPPAPRPETAFSGTPLRKQQHDNGLTVQDFDLGEGRAVQAGDHLVIHYTGKLDDGSIFDSSIKRNRALQFAIGAGRMLKGWELGLLGMRPGGLRKLIVPPQLGYGKRGKGKVPPNARLTYTIELVAVR